MICPKPLRRVCGGAAAIRRHMPGFMLACAVLVAACAPAPAPTARPARPQPAQLNPQPAPVNPQPAAMRPQPAPAPVRPPAPPPVAVNQTPAAPAQPDRMPERNAAATEPCALLMHDRISLALLGYFIQHGSFPERLEQLRADPEFADLPLACPVSGKPFGYAPNGLVISQRGGPDLILLVYETAPAHSGYRWAIQVVPSEPVPGNPLIQTTAHLEVVPVLESTMRAALAR